MKTPILIPFCAVLMLGTLSACTEQSAVSPEPVVAEATAVEAPVAVTPADAFFSQLSTLCGNSFAGRLAAHNESDLEAFGGPAVMQVRDCNQTEIRIPFHVGEDHSRTWIITRSAAGLRLKHDHRQPDGSMDAMNFYGGDSAGLNDGSASRQEFPADAESKAMFIAGGLTASVDNVWAIEVLPGELFAYELRRPDRHFRVEFDLHNAVAAPPAPWGSEL